MTNWLPVQGIHYLIDHKFIRSSKPEDIAGFLLRTEGLNKATIGEYLGDGYVFALRDRFGNESDAPFHIGTKLM